MDLADREDPSVVETVEVVSGGGGGGSERVLSPGGTETTLKILNSANLSIPSSGIIEIDPQALSLVQMTSSNFDVSTVTPLSLAATQVTSQAILSDMQHMKNKRPLQEASPDVSTPEVPRKKSRNYLDSHKSIEKKRRDRINNGLTSLKEMVPNCRQYVNQGNKKLDKAEILEMTIDYIHRLQAQNQANGRGNVDLETSQREWINDLMSWIFHNKMLYTGVEQFANALLLHLQSLGSTPTTSATATAAAGLMYNQFPEGGSASEDEGIHQSTLLQQLTTAANAVAAASEGTSEGNNGEGTGEEIEKDSTTIPPVEGGEGGGEGGASTVNQQQTQLAQLQALLLLQQQQMYQSQQQEGANVDPQQMQQLQQLHQLQTLLLQHLTNEKQAASLQEVGGEVTVTPTQSVMVTTSAMESTGGTLELTSALNTPAVFTSEEETLTDRGSQMWSQPEHTQHGDVSSLLIEGEGGGVQEEVELLEQEH